jgi:hypothetical protein
VLIYITAMITVFNNVLLLVFISDLLSCRHDSLLFIQTCSQHHIKMRISFGTNTNNELRVTFQACAILAFVFWQFECVNILERSQKSVFMLKMPNVTLVTGNLYYYDSLLHRFFTIWFCQL